MNKRKNRAVRSSKLLLFPSLSSGYCRNPLVLQAGGTVPCLGSRLFKTNTSKMKLQTEISWVRWLVLLSRQLILTKWCLPIHMDIHLHYRKQSSGKRSNQTKNSRLFYCGYLHPHNFVSDKNSTTSHLHSLLLHRHHHRHPYRGLQQEDEFDVKDVTSVE